jgi:IS5 family transposase
VIHYLEVEDRSLRAGGDGGRPTTSMKSAAAAVARARERERKRETEKEEVGAGFKYELVASVRLVRLSRVTAETRLVDTCYKMARLSVAPQHMA